MMDSLVVVLLATLTLGMVCGAILVKVLGAGLTKTQKREQRECCWPEYVQISKAGEHYHMSDCPSLKRRTGISAYRVCDKCLKAHLSHSHR